MGTDSTMLSALARRSVPTVFAAQARGMAAAAKKVEVPLKLHGLDGRYATSLWKVAEEGGVTATVEKDLENFRKLFTNDAVNQLCNNPSIPKNAKTGAVKALMENGRLGEVEAVIDAFASIQRAAKGEVYAEITVADELSAAQKKSLEKSLSSFVEKGSKVSVEYKVDPSILGGLVVDVGDKHINMSILARVQQLQNLINQPI